MDVKIFIPTRGRVGESKQITLRELKTHCSVPPILVHPPDEHHAYWEHCAPCDAVGIGPTREWILQNTTADIAIMADDDMYFYRRNEDQKLVKHPNMDWFIAWVVDKVRDGYIHGGMSARQGNGHMKLGKHLTQKGERIVGRVNNLHFFHVPSYRDLISGGFTKLPVMEDFYVTLSLLRLGYPNIVSFDYCWNQRGSGTDGGCALYRTLEMQAEAAEGLKAAFPDFVKVVTKTNFSETVGSVFKEPRKDVNIQWRKAFESFCSDAGKSKPSSYTQDFEPAEYHVFLRDISAVGASRTPNRMRRTAEGHG